MPTATVLETRGLRKRYGDREVVRGVDLRVPRGVAFGFLGPNGAGKTTVIRMLLGLTQADGGTMEMLGRALPADRRAALARVGAIVEEPRFHGRMTGRESLWIHAAVLGREAEGRIPGALRRVGLAGREDDRVDGYSLGMRQRLGIARCLLADPELLVLDEPANGLDPGGIRELRALVRSLVDEGRTVFLSSHLLDEVERTCDMAAVISDGRIVAQGTLDELAAAEAPRVTLRLARAAEAVALLAARPDVVDARSTHPEEVEVRLRATGADAERAATAELVRQLVGRGFSPYAVSSGTRRLEDRVLELLGGPDERPPTAHVRPDRTLLEAR